MATNRAYIDKIADVVRGALSLEIPIRMDALCKSVQELGGRCIAYDSGQMNVDAQITTENLSDETYQFEIRYLVNKPDTRSLFSVAHELGHLFLHLLQSDGTLQAETFERSMETTQQEMEANEFAAALLMPEEAFIMKSHECMSDNRVNINEVAGYFNVSVQAATVRGNVLGLW